MNKAVFLDRDGTMIVHVPYLNSPEEVRLLPHTAEGIRLFRENGYQIFVVTNQSGVARGIFDEECLHTIHTKLKRILEMEGITIDDIYYCPHHTEGIVAQYKFDCDCRKPKPGMLLHAARRHRIDLSRSIMIGDSLIDMLAGKRAGCKCVLIQNGKGEKNDISLPEGTDFRAHDLLEAARLFMEESNF